MKTKHFNLFAAVTFLLIILVFGWGIGNVNFFLKLIYSTEQIADNAFLQNIGTFGDSAGLLNALFSSLAFGGVILTIIWQVSENSRQRKEEHRIQFENVFFNMTGSLEKIVSELKVEYRRDTNKSIISTQLWDMKGEDTDSQEANDDSPQYITGRAVFKYLYEDAPEPLEEIIKKEGILGFETAMYGMLDNYFRYLYRVLKYIDESTLIEKKEKYKYVGILRAQLSYMELIMVYYNCLSEYGNEKFKPLVEKYHLLKNIRKDRLHDSKLNGRVIGVAKEYMYNTSAWDANKESESMENYKIEQFCFRIVYAIFFALIFNTLLSDWWHHHINILWYGMTEIVVRGLVLMSIVAGMVYYQMCDKAYRDYFVKTRDGGKLWKRTWNRIKGNYTLPVFLFLSIVTTYTIRKYHVVWYDSYTVYLDLSFLYFPLIADILAMVVNVTREADFLEKLKEEKV